MSPDLDGRAAGGRELVVVGPCKPDMNLDQWWCAAPCGTANRSFRIRCRTCGAPELPKAARSALYCIPAQHQ